MLFALKMHETTKDTGQSCLRNEEQTEASKAYVVEIFLLMVVANECHDASDSD